MGHQLFAEVIQPCAEPTVAPQISQPSTTSSVTPQVPQPSAGPPITTESIQPCAEHPVAPQISQPSAESPVADKVTQATFGSPVAPHISLASARSSVAPQVPQLFTGPPATDQAVLPPAMSSLALHVPQPSKLPVTTQVLQPFSGPGVSTSLVEPVMHLPMHEDSGYSLTTLNTAISFENSQHEDFPRYHSSSSPVEQESMLNLLYEQTNNGAAHNACVNTSESCSLCFCKDLEIRDLKFKIRFLEQEISQLRDGNQGNLYLQVLLKCYNLYLDR